jgi:hypothetical protein
MSRPGSHVFHIEASLTSSQISSGAAKVLTECEVLNITLPDYKIPYFIDIVIVYCLR